MINASFYVIFKGQRSCSAISEPFGKRLHCTAKSGGMQMSMIVDKMYWKAYDSRVSVWHMHVYFWLYAMPIWKRHASLW
ncbi:MAG: hypothetical protein A3C02_00595 [Candidatus Andersenbacteria bacterium RIFCSPHIGHO2_02_FULL_45_11]|nr:MAG: hypothetical protein A2805_02545 [Candidatus Andersenbacteria bacterium RIFCSPHIGHO2_01_FULL_46_36]OGY31899.1 MAG: hypothetical protein A3C02_00595 [Candidatus Andersenbacteria bacterium RIFCSPHIGHO2_02_FULL_45_11]